MEKNSYMMNPYVEQMEKFGKSLEHLADTFFRMEERKGQFTSGEVEEMFPESLGQSVRTVKTVGVLVKIRYGQSNLYMKF